MLLGFKVVPKIDAYRYILGMYFDTFFVDAVQPIICQNMSKSGSIDYLTVFDSKDPII